MKTPPLLRFADLKVIHGLWFANQKFSRIFYWVHCIDKKKQYLEAVHS
jgi:hypothetical protein